MEILTSKKFPYHGSVQKVGSIMEICLEVAMISMIWRGHDFSSAYELIFHLEVLDYVFS